MAEQLFQIGIKALIRNDKGEILLLHIPAWHKNTDHWDMPGGRMDAGEDFTQTLKRELMEEIGVSFVGKPKLIQAYLTKAIIPVDGKDVSLVVIAFETQLAAGAVVKLNPDSYEDDCRWFKPKEAAKVLSTKYTNELCDYISSLD